MEDFMTLQEVAEMYRVSVKTVRRWIARGDLAAERLPGDRMIRIDTANVANLTRPVGNQSERPRRGIHGYWTIKKPKIPSTANSKTIVITDYFPEEE